MEKSFVILECFCSFFQKHWSRTTCIGLGLSSITINSYGLNTIISDNFTLSAGQIQKLQFARALLKNSQILLIDEITANLDGYSPSLVLKICENLKDQGRAIFYVSHLNDQPEIADSYFDMS